MEKSTKLLQVAALFLVLVANFCASVNQSYPLSATVSLRGPHQVTGWAAISQTGNSSPVVVEGQVHNLPVGTYGINVHESGDTAYDCSNVGTHFNPTGQKHGKLTDPERHAGDLGTIQSVRGVGTIAKFRISTPSLSLNEGSRRNINNLSLVISQRFNPDDESSEIALACGNITPGKRNVQEKLEPNPGTPLVDTNVQSKAVPPAGSTSFTVPVENNRGVLAELRAHLRKIFIPESRTAPGQPGKIFSFPDKNVDNIGLRPNSDTILRNPKPEERDLAENIAKNYGNEFSVCYRDLGCLYTDSSWYNKKYRVVNLPPANLASINTKFYLHTRETCFRDVLLNPFDNATIQDSSFDGARQTKFIVHGFTNSGQDPWITRMVNALLGAGDFNVIVVDWMRGALPIYAQAAANTRVVGMQIAYLVRRLANLKGLKHEDVHIIGHSLGAQVAGYAGQNFTTVETKLGRITGLDPAGPYFVNMPRHIRLDPGDATYVEALHTNALVLYQLGYGTTELVGHVDFFPNGGSFQPGCEILSLVSIPYMKQYWNSGDIFACNHNRAVDLYTDAITYGRMIGYECKDYETFLRAGCNACRPNDLSCAAEFGLNGSAARVQGRQNNTMYFVTSSFSPFALIHYKVTVYTDPTETTGMVRGYVNITINGSLNDIKQEPLTKDVITIKHGLNHTFLLTSPIDVGNVTTVQLHWEPPVCLTPLKGLCGGPVFVKSVQIGQMTLSDPEARLAKIFRPCGRAKRQVPSSSYRIAPKETKLFSLTCNQGALLT